MGRGLQRKLLRPPPWGEGLRVRPPELCTAAYTPGLTSILRSNAVNTGRKIPPTWCLRACKRHFGDRSHKANGPRAVASRLDPAAEETRDLPAASLRGPRLLPRGGPRTARPDRWPGKRVRPAPGTCELTHGDALGTGRPLRRRLPEREAVVTTPGHRRIDRRHRPEAGRAAIPGPTAANGIFTGD